MSSEVKFYVYRLVCPIDKIPKYIGITKRVLKRKYEHRSYNQTYKNYLILKWKKNLQRNNLKPIFQVIEGPVSDTDAILKEIKWIKFYKSLNYRLLNLTDGGDVTPMPENHNSIFLKGKKLESYYGESRAGIIRNKISLGITGSKNPNYGSVYCTDEWRENQKKSQSKKPLLVHTRDGNFVGEFRNSKDCAKALGVNSGQVRQYKITGWFVKRQYLITDKL